MSNKHSRIKTDEGTRQGWLADELLKRKTEEYETGNEDSTMRDEIETNLECPA